MRRIQPEDTLGDRETEVYVRAAKALEWVFLPLVVVAAVLWLVAAYVMGAACQLGRRQKA